MRDHVGVVVADPSKLVDLAQAVRVVGLAAGLDRVGVASADPFTEARIALEQRKARGLHATMQFTYRNPARATEPAQALVGVRSLVVAAKAYPRDIAEPDPREDVRGPLARVARYATGDHYGMLRAGLDAVAGRLQADGWRTRVLLDDNALVDRAAAHRAGLGWYGKNANILIEGAGSWFVLGSVLTDAPLPVAEQPVEDGCHACTRCLDGCPTGAIIEPGVVDARRCLAWLVQAEGTFPSRFREALGDRIYGCDVCQEVCPPSNRTTRVDTSPPSPPSLPVSAETDSDPAPIMAWVQVLDLLELDDDELLARFGRWYIPRREPRYLRRNALIVLANASLMPPDPHVRGVLRRYLRDPDPLLRAHAVWATKRLGMMDLLPPAADERDPDVLAELAATVVARAGSGSRTERGAIVTTVTIVAPPIRRIRPPYEG